MACTAGDLAPVDPVDPGSAPLRRLTNVQLSNTVADLFPGVSVPALVLVDDSRIHGLDNNAAAQEPSALWTRQWHTASGTIAEAVVASGTLPCDPATAGCAEVVLEELGPLAFRRPLTAGEGEAYQALLADLRTADPDESIAVHVLIQALLGAPEFLYLVEEGLPEPGERAAPLTGHELAARLSYLLWNTMPDAQLRAAAAAGGLDTADGVEAEAWRLLEDPRARAGLGHFHSLWLELDAIAEVTLLAEVYPDFDADSRDAMRSELDAFVEHAIFDGDGTYSALLLDRWARNTAYTAGVYDAERGEVTLPDAERAGILTRAGWLAATSHEVHPSPVQRGIFVLERLLCQRILPPPGDVDTTLPADGPDAVTNRERYNAHLFRPDCAVCHRSIDPVGFAFEHYDSAGAWRDLDAGQPVDATGTLVSGDLDGVGFDGPLELSAHLATSGTARGCYVQNWSRYALGRDIERTDARWAAPLTARFGQSGGDVRQLLVDLVRTEAFRSRRAE